MGVLKCQPPSLFNDFLEYHSYKWIRRTQRCIILLLINESLSYVTDVQICYPLNGCHSISLFTGIFSLRDCLVGGVWVSKITFCYCQLIFRLRQICSNACLVGISPYQLAVLIHTQACLQKHVHFSSPNILSQFLPFQLSGANPLFTIELF